MRRREKRITGTSRICTSKPEGSTRYTPSYGVYSSITEAEKLNFILETTKKEKLDKLDRKLDNSWESLVRKVSEYQKASERLGF